MHLSLCSTLMQTDIKVVSDGDRWTLTGTYGYRGQAQMDSDRHKGTHLEQGLQAPCHSIGFCLDMRAQVLTQRDEDNATAVDQYHKHVLDCTKKSRKKCEGKLMPWKRQRR